ncbi:prominin-2-like [Sphaerodactylus townsendi]|uniref:prominin-2-like n=1 Tax=Sphaerodactylus townsendi TaxID=933632 RepID=UPI002026BF42|nr:prominin-2-like [Sphaerodactylus townsendi]
MNITKRLGLKKGLNLTTAYRQCRNGAGLWEILQLEESYSLNNHLSVTQYTAEFQKRLDEFNFTFEDILLTRDGKRDLETFKESGIDRIDFTGFLTELILRNKYNLQVHSASPPSPPARLYEQEQIGMLKQPWGKTSQALDLFSSHSDCSDDNNG